MKSKQLIWAAVGAGAMGILILDGKTAVAGAAEGIDLCIRTLIPALFPFLVASAMLTASLTGHAVMMFEPLGRFCGIPRGAESLLVVGLLGGYPVGAANVYHSWRSGGISRQDAARMLAFCNNAGPAFLFGILGPLFSDPKTPWFLWGIHIISALTVAAVTPGHTSEISCCRPGPMLGLSGAVEKSLHTMALICGWVVVFRLVITFLERWFFWYLPPVLQVTAAGLLELTNGCIQLSRIQDEGLRFLIAGIILSLGGLCVTMQTVSIIDGLSLRYYFPGKLLQCCVSIWLSCLAQMLFPAGQRFPYWAAVSFAMIPVVVILHFWLQGVKKSSSNPALVGV